MKFAALTILAGILAFPLWAGELGKPDASAAQPTPASAHRFWSFQSVKNPPIPEVRNKRWPQSPVDNFILSRLDAKKTAPAPAADKRTLIRRTTFDLTGLPPTPQEIDAFLSDHSPDAFKRVIDRLLASPRYGECWGRHWLDLARYADTAGDSADFPVPQAYRYRNYVIDSFNRDKPYDQFLREQIAGDLLPAQSEGEREEHSIATGYIASSRRFGVSPLMYQTIDDTIDNIGKAILGLTVGCARCHDHKFDPIPTQDYYALYGIFSSTRYPQPGCEASQHQGDFVPLAPPDEVERLLKPYQNELALLEEQLKELGKKREAAQLAANADKAKSADPPDPNSATTSTNQSYLKQVEQELDEAKKKRAELVSTPPPIEMAYAVIDGKPENARVHMHGEPNNPGEEVRRHFLQVLGGQSCSSDCKDSGRLELAEWLTDSTNPLTARVMVNRIWQYHFGRGIVASPNDFGVRGKPPTHPELLDYLAARFIASGWSVKAMHKLIMLSSAYQLSSRDDSKNTVADPGDDLLWKFRRKRLDAEEIRDAMLLISGGLDETTADAQPFPPAHKWTYTQHYPFNDVYETDRRSVYLMVQRIKKQPFLELFDGADPNACTGSRAISTTPLQALFMMNGDLTARLAGKFADRICNAADNDKARLDLAHQLAWGRPPTTEELRLGEAYLRQFIEKLRHTDIPVERRESMAWTSYARVLFSSNEFMFVE